MEEGGGESGKGKGGGREGEEEGGGGVVCLSSCMCVTLLTLQPPVPAFFLPLSSGVQLW